MPFLPLFYPIYASSIKRLCVAQCRAFDCPGRPPRLPAAAPAYFYARSFGCRFLKKGVLRPLIPKNRGFTHGTPQKNRFLPFGAKRPFGAFFNWNAASQ
jgi:hypothetical protein